MYQTNWTKKVEGLAGVLVFLGILVAINYLIAGMRLRTDLTEDRLFTLSGGTKKIVGDLSRQVTLKFYVSRNLEGPAAVPVKQFAQRVEDLLREYAQNSHGKIVLETYDPKPDSDEEEWAQKYGLTGQGMGMLGEGPRLYCGIVAVCGAREAAIPFVSPEAEPQLEYHVTRMVYEVTQEKKPKIGVLSALPVMGMPRMPYGPQQGGSEPWAIIGELKETYDLVSVTPDTDEIAGDLDALVVIHPRDLSEKLLFALDQYVLRGGRLLVFEDPMCVTQNEISRPEMGMPPEGPSSDLNRLTKTWGLEMNTAKMVADFRAATRIRVSEDRAERNPSWLSLRRENIERKEVSTGSLELLMMPFAGSFSGKPAEGLKMTTLAQTSDDAGEIDTFTFYSPDRGTLRDFQKAHKALPLAVRLQGRFKTAFPDGKPRDAGDTNAAPAKVAALKAGAKDAVVILVSDVDMLNDRFCLETGNFLGQKVRQSANDNINFALNMVEQLTGSEQLVGLRSRGSFERPFERVLALEQQAQERWREEELKLQEKLRQAQERLQELQSSKDAEQKFILSAEQKREIEKFRQEQFQTQQQLKEVRKNFRREIEALGIKLKIVNMAAVPFLVALFGIVRGWRRRKG